MAKHDSATDRTASGEETSPHERTSRGDESRLSSRPPADRHEPGDHEIGHGNSMAAWVAAGVIIAGSLVSSIAVIQAAVPWFWVGVAMIVVGAVLGKVLSMMGFGAKTEPVAGAAAGSGHVSEPGR